MSTKRAALLAKDRCLLTKNNQQNFYGNQTAGICNDQYSNINLNQQQKCKKDLNNLQSKSIHSLNENKGKGCTDFNDSFVKSGAPWKRNDLFKSCENILNREKEEFKWKNKDNKEGCNKSTLSLHIAAYENLIEAQNDNANFMEKASKQNQFVFPRQQHFNEELMKPEVMQFKASQKLMNLHSRREESSPLSTMFQRNFNFAQQITKSLIQLQKNPVTKNLHLSSTRNFGIPLVIDNDGRTERVYDIYSRLLKDRIICVMSPIDDHVASAIIAQLLFLQSDSSKSPIHMYINSPGGSVTAGLGIYDTMQYISAPVATWCIGQASSMGSLLLCAGEKGMRTALPNSRIMVHQPSGGAQGTASDILIRAEEIVRLRRRLNEIYSTHTGQSVEKIHDTLDRDRFMSSQEAKDFGLIDRIEIHPGSIPADVTSPGPPKAIVEPL